MLSGIYLSSFVSELRKKFPSYFIPNAHKKLLNLCTHVSVGCRFTSDVKIKSISVVGGADGTSPSRMRALVLEIQHFLSFSLSFHEIY